MNPHLVLRATAKLLIPLIIVFALYVQFHGDYGAGGGFQAGAIFAAAIILYALVFGVHAAKRAVPPWAVRIGISLGVLIFAGTGIMGWVLGGNYLDYDVLHPDTSHSAGQHLGILLVELGVLVTVASVMLAIFYAFASREQDISEEDW